MYRSQLILEEWQYEALKSLSAREGKSVSAVAREILATYLSEKHEAKRSRLEEIEGIGDDGKATGKAHDRFLYGKTKRR